MTTTSPYPILYSFRRCPYAMRARMALLQSGITVELREVVLRDKPTQLLEASTKATVPVLVLTDGKIIDESQAIMHWALQQHDPDMWCNPNFLNKTKCLIHENDMDFKTQLDLYKYAARFSEDTRLSSRHKGLLFLNKLEHCLEQHRFLCANQISMADIAIMPFIRQFSHVDTTWFAQTNMPRLQQWLTYFLESILFLEVMHKYPAWKSGEKVTLFPASHKHHFSC